MIGQRDILINIVELLETHKIPYLLTGSFAVSYYGFPRATHDIDFVVELHTSEKEKMLQVLRKLGEGFDYDARWVEEAVGLAGHFDVLHADSGVKIDFWVRKPDEFERNKFRRKRTITIGKTKTATVSAEDLILTKLLWCKDVRSERHLRDCAGIVNTQQDELDWQYLNRWAKKLHVTDLLSEVKESEYDGY